MSNNNISLCNLNLCQNLIFQGLSEPISAYFQPYFDLLRIYSLLEPDPSALSGMHITTLTDDQVYAIAQKDPSRKYIYTQIAKKGRLTVLSRPRVIDKKICFWKVPASILNINAESLCPYMIKKYAEDMYGSLDELRLAYLEARTDIYGTNLQEILKRLLVLRKRYLCNYQDTTIYAGKAPKHQIVTYDRKGKMPDNDKAPVRVEARIRFEGKGRPYLKDWLEGRHVVKDPFKKAFLVDVDALGLTRDEKIALAKCKHGLTGFMMSLSKKNKRNRKTVLQRHARKNIILDLNALFNTWESAWHKCVIPQCQVLSNKPDLNSSHTCPGEEEAV